jgi:hypothetical protein
MIKLIIYCTRAIIVIIVALLMTSCKYDIDLGDGITGSGNVIKEKRTVNGTFTKIEVNRGLEVIVEQANDTEIEVEADDNIIKHITTNIENGVLVITTDESFNSSDSQIVRVKMPTITSLESTSGSNIRSNNTLKGTNLKIDSNSGSEIELVLEYDDVKTESTSGSSINLAGKALKLKTSSSSGSEIDADNLIANDIISDASSGSTTSVQPLVSLKASASSGASIDYKGTPKTVTEEENSGGDVSKN